MSAPCPRAALTTFVAHAPKQLLLYDGTCFFCDGQVAFLLRQKPSKSLFFSNVQAPEGQLLVKHWRPELAALDTIFLIERKTAVSADASVSLTQSPPSSSSSCVEKIFDEHFTVTTKSSAALRCAMLSESFFMRFLAVIAYYCVPRFVRDAGYDFVAKRRFAPIMERFGGKPKAAACLVPSKALKAQFWTWPDKKASH